MAVLRLELCWWKAVGPGTDDEGVGLAVIFCGCVDAAALLFVAGYSIGRSRPVDEEREEEDRNDMSSTEQKAEDVLVACDLLHVLFVFPRKGVSVYFISKLVVLRFSPCMRVAVYLPFST